MSQHSWIAVAILIVIPVALAWNVRFIQDDAYISYTYAKSFVEGNGLTWFGERVEGYTNFLWVMWIALGMAFSIDPVSWSFAGGLLAFAATVFSVSKLSQRLFGEQLPSLLAVVLFAGNFSVLSYATGGLETMLQTALLTSAALLIYRRFKDESPDVKHCAMLSVVTVAALLTRLDSAVIGVVILAHALLFMKKKRLQLIHYIVLLLPLVVTMAAWTFWRIDYYGKVLPNTFYAKVGWDPTDFGNGLLYLARFVHWYLIWPFLLAGIILMVWKRMKLPPQLIMPVVIVLTWCCYIMAVGGDFMEFRFVVPMAPFLFVLLAYFIWYQIGLASRRPRVVAVVSSSLLIIMSVVHARSFKELTPDFRLDSIPMLSTFYGLYADGNWSKVGDRLKEDLGETNAIIATSGVGAIPFYSGVQTVDIVGLCDVNVGKPGAFVPATHYRPGHKWKVTYSYLKERGVNFVLDQPTPVRRGVIANPAAVLNLARWVRSCAFFDEEPDSVVTVVGMQVDAEISILMWYLTPSTVLDSIIQTRNWETAKLRM